MALGAQPMIAEPVPELVDDFLESGESLLFLGHKYSRPTRHAPPESAERPEYARKSRSPIGYLFVRAQPLGAEESAQ